MSRSKNVAIRTITQVGGALSADVGSNGPPQTGCRVSARYVAHFSRVRNEKSAPTLRAHSDSVIAYEEFSVSRIHKKPAPNMSSEGN